MTENKCIRFVVGGLGADREAARWLVSAVLGETQQFKNAKAWFSCSSYSQEVPDSYVLGSTISDTEGQLINQQIEINSQLFFHMPFFCRAIAGCAVVPFQEPLKRIWARNESVVTKPAHLVVLPAYSVAVFIGKRFEDIDLSDKEVIRQATIYREDVPTKTIFLSTQPNDKVSELAGLLGGLYQIVDFSSRDHVRDAGICLGRLLMEDADVFPSLMVRQGPVFTTGQGESFFRQCVRTFCPIASVPHQPA